MSYLACATYPDTDHVRDAILALSQYGIPRERCGMLWLRAPGMAERDAELSHSAAAIAPVTLHDTANGPMRAVGVLDPALGEESRSGPAGRGWLVRMLMAEGVPQPEAEELERRVLGGEVLLTVRAGQPSAALEQLLSWTGAFRFSPLALFDEAAPALLQGGELPEFEVPE